MVVAAPTFLRVPFVLRLRHPGKTPFGNGLDQASTVYRLLLSLPLCCKNDSNVFNHIQPLISVFVGPNPLFSTASSLFFAKQGG
jgi:hypothetical protein